MNKKYVLSGLVLISFAGYAVFLKLPRNGERVRQVMTPIPVPTIVASIGRYKDGVYTGSVADAFYGNVQVQVTVSGGKITDVVFLQYPNDRSTSVEINQQAMPYLKQEAIQVQNSQVDTVSGASQTSRAFRESLASALSQAK